MAKVIVSDLYWECLEDLVERVPDEMLSGATRLIAHLLQCIEPGSIYVTGTHADMAAAIGRTAEEVERLMAFIATTGLVIRCPDEAPFPWRFNDQMFHPSHFAHNNRPMPT